MRTYTTVSGDTWDLISYRVYGSESYVHILMEANMDALDTFVFSAGVTLNVPEIDYLGESEADYPEWRQSGGVDV